MRDDTLKRTRSREDDPIRPWAPASVRVVAAQDGELVISPGAGEVEVLVIIVLVWIVIAAHGLASLKVVAALGYGFVDVGLPVAC